MFSIEQLRQEVQERDKQIIRELALRQEICQQIALLKKKEGKPILDREQEQKNFELYDSQAKQYALDSNWIAGIFRLIVNHSILIQSATID